MDVSSLSCIENPSENPMQLFATWHNEAKECIYPNLFTDTMTIASLNEVDELLNRNVILRKHDLDGFIFVTERNTQKYKDFVRITGNVTELTNAEIAEFYKDEPLFAKIRSKIFRCGEKVDWNELKANHDQVLNGYRDGNEMLTKRDTYTAMRIIPQKMDFYYARRNEIADRVKYTIENGNWDKCHVAA